jgi:hypothetical protein
VSLTAVAVIPVQAPTGTGTGETTGERLAGDLVDARSAIEVARMATDLQGSAAKFRY